MEAQSAGPPSSGSSCARSRTRRGFVWTDESLGAELRAFVEGRGFWPPREQFRAARRNDLWIAADWLGGHALWAYRCGLARAKALGSPGLGPLVLDRTDRAGIEPAVPDVATRTPDLDHVVAEEPSGVLQVHPAVDLG